MGATGIGYLVYLFGAVVTYAVSFFVIKKIIYTKKLNNQLQNQTIDQNQGQTHNPQDIK